MFAPAEEKEGCEEEGGGDAGENGKGDVVVQRGEHLGREEREYGGSKGAGETHGSNGGCGIVGAVGVCYVAKKDVREVIDAETDAD